MSRPHPLRLSLEIRTTVRCSGCPGAVTVDALPLVVRMSGPPEVDGVGLAESLPDGWRLGSMRPGVLVAPGVEAPPPGPMPVAFCPSCSSERTS